MKESENIFVNNDGIKIRYDNNNLKLNYYNLYINLCKANGVDPDKNKLSRAGKEEWMEIYNEVGISVLEFQDEYMIIPWELIEEWKTIRNYNYLKNSDFMNVTKFKGLEHTFNIEVTDIELENYFNKIIPEKRLNKVDVTPFLKFKRYIVYIGIILAIVYIVKFFIMQIKI